MNSENETKNVVQWRLGRAARRAVRVVERHRDKSQVVAEYDATLAPKVSAYLALLDKVNAMTANQRRTLAEARARVAELYRAVATWLGLLARDMPEVDMGEPDGDSRVLDDVMRRATTLIENVRLHGERGAQPLSYAQALTTELETLIARATEANRVAEDARAELQERRRDLRAIASGLHDELIALRRVLRSVLGSTHVDYQKLRLNRIRRSDEDPDDEVATQSAAGGELPAASEAPGSDADEAA